MDPRLYLAELNPRRVIWIDPSDVVKSGNLLKESQRRDCHVVDGDWDLGCWSCVKYRSSSDCKAIVGALFHIKLIRDRQCGRCSFNIEFYIFIDDRSPFVF